MASVEGAVVSAAAMVTVMVAVAVATVVAARAGTGEGEEEATGVEMTEASVDRRQAARHLLVHAC